MTAGAAPRPSRSCGAAEVSRSLPTRLWGEVTWAAVLGQTAAVGNWLGLVAYAAGFAAVAIWGYRRDEGASYR
jgi:ABC-2 type transport system permease protein